MMNKTHLSKSFQNVSFSWLAKKTKGQGPGSTLWIVQLLHQSSNHNTINSHKTKNSEAKKNHNYFMWFVEALNEFL